MVPPANGMAEIWNSDKVRYHAEVDHVGLDTVTYRICDTGGRCSQATLTIELTP